jgi:ketosteroid isomerase-like protein
MNQELEDIVRSAFKAVDNADLKAIFDMMADDIEQVDELTKKWSRGKANVVAAMTPLFSIVNSIESVLSDFHATVSNDIAVVTCMLDQIYVLEGKVTTIVAPTTCVLRRDTATWKFILIHSLPFSDA